MEENIEIWELRDRELKLYYQGCKDGCFIRLQGIQGNSADWAQKYEGWTIKKAEGLSHEEIAKIMDEDPYLYRVAQIRDDVQQTSRWIRVWYKDEKYLAFKNACIYNDLKSGSEIHVPRRYLRKEED